MTHGIMILGARGPITSLLYQSARVGGRRSLVHSLYTRHTVSRWAGTPDSYGRWISTSCALAEKADPNALTERRAGTELSTSRKVVQAGKDAGYGLVILAGIGIFVAAIWLVFKETFGSGSPNAIYGRSLKLLRRDDRVGKLVGKPFKAFGTGHRRRWHVAHGRYLENDLIHVRVEYHIKGNLRQATVHVDMKQVAPGKNKYEYNYLIVEADGYPPSAIAVIDNRGRY